MQVMSALLCASSRPRSPVSLACVLVVLFLLTSCSHRSCMKENRSELTLILYGVGLSRLR